MSVTHPDKRSHLLSERSKKSRFTDPMPSLDEVEAYLQRFGMREKLEEALLPIYRAKTLPTNPFTGLVAAFTEFEILCKAKLIFDQMDADKSGTIDRKELCAKLQADGELEALLGRKDIKGEGLSAAKAVSEPDLNARLSRPRSLELSDGLRAPCC